MKLQRRRRKPTRPGLTVATGLVAATPILVSAVRGLSEGWVPFGDQAVIAARAYDVLSLHIPLVGQYSASSALTGHPTYSLGPLLYWLLALPARLGPPAAVALAVSIVNSAAVVGAVALARRRGGDALMLATAIALALMSRSLAPETLHDPWNPSAGVLPFTLLIFLCWSLACGEYRLLPVAVVVASFVVQCHFAYVPAALGMIVIGVAGLVVSLRGRGYGSARRWLLGALVLGTISWSGPLIDELTNRPGNLTLVARAASANEPTVGLTLAERTLARAVGAPPWWLRSTSDPFHNLADIQSVPSAVALTSAALAVLALALVTIFGLRRRRADIAAGGAIGLVLCAALVAVTAYTPTRPFLMNTLGYTLWWGSPAGMFIWLFLGWSAALSLGGRVRVTDPRARSAAIVATAAAVLAVAVLVSAGEGPDLHRRLYGPVSTIAARLDDAIPRGSNVRITGSGGVVSVLQAGVRFELRRDDIRALSGASRRWGPEYDIDHRRYGYVVYLTDGGRPSASRARVLGYVRVQDAGQEHTISIAVLGQ